MRCCVVAFSIVAGALPAQFGCARPRGIPVILDTDIGGDIDDTWALALTLVCPELDLKLVVSDSRNAEGKAKIIAKFLQRVGRTDVPVGVGLKRDNEIGAQGPWVEDYDLAAYPGTVHKDGVQAMIDVIMKSQRPITLLAIGPVPNLAEALHREPGIAQRARLVVMGGSIERQYRGQPGRCAEYNVKHEPKAAQAAYMADWDVTIAPLDTAGIVTLTGKHYARIRDADNPLAKTLMENYRIWTARCGNRYDPGLRSSILFDTVAVYLAFDDKLCQMHDIRIRVTDDGMTEPDPQGKLVHAAMDWTDMDAFCELLADRIASGCLTANAQ